MSKVVEAYKQILENIQQLFPDKSKIPNAYSLPDNAEGLLRNGWGITIGPASNQPLEFCSMTVVRNLSVVFTQEFVATESDDQVPDDIGIKLLEDVFMVQKMMFAPDRMEIAELDNVEIVDASGVSTVVSGNRKFLTMSAGFIITISEKY